MIIWICLATIYAQQLWSILTCMFHRIGPAPVNKVGLRARPFVRPPKSKDDRKKWEGPQNWGNRRGTDFSNLSLTYIFFALKPSRPLNSSSRRQPPKTICYDPELSEVVLSRVPLWVCVFREMDKWTYSEWKIDNTWRSNQFTPSNGANHGRWLDFRETR